MYSLQCTVLSVQFTLYMLQCTVYSLHCKVYSVWCIVYSVQCTLYCVLCKMHSAQCKMFSAKCKIILCVCFRGPVGAEFCISLKQKISCVICDKYSDWIKVRNEHQFYYFTYLQKMIHMEQESNTCSKI